MMKPTSPFILSLLLFQFPFIFASTQLEESSSSLLSDNGKLTAVEKLPAPAGCKKLPSDSDWPSEDVVQAELPGWEPAMPDGKMKHPDYIYEVKSVASAQRAVRFAAKHNIRLSIINSGHDFLGR
jgi:hypothetical protein